MTTVLCPFIFWKECVLVVLLVSLGSSSGTNFRSVIIPIYTHWTFLGLRNRRQLWTISVNKDIFDLYHEIFHGALINKLTSHLKNRLVNINYIPRTAILASRQHKNSSSFPFGKLHRRTLRESCASGPWSWVQSKGPYPGHVHVFDNSYRW